MSYELIEKLKREIADFHDESKWEDAGEVIEVGDGILKVSGLRNAVSQELLRVEAREGSERMALALNLGEETIGALVLGEYKGIQSGDAVRTTGTILSVEVGPEILGRVVDPLGNPMDGKGPLFSGKSDTSLRQRMFLEEQAPSVVDRESVNTPLHTGIKAIDAMIPIGRGQRELIIGDRQTGKTAIALDVIVNQQKEEGEPPVCIYVAIGQKESKVARMVETLKEQGAMGYTVVVSAPASSSAAFWYLAPFAGCAIGEYFRNNGKDAVVIYDDLSKHASAYRQISLLLRRPPGREAYPGDVFYLHSRLLERSAKLSKEKGGGSLTALPIIETQLGDVTAYVPTNVISITDGQIYLEADLFNKGMRPAINAGLSVSRVGSTAQTKAMKKVAGKLRLTLAQFRELQSFVQFASDVDDETKKRIQEGRVMTELLKQSDLSPVPFERQVVLFYAAINGYLKDIKPEDIQKFEAEFTEYLEKFHEADLLAPLREKKAIDEEIEKTLKEVIQKFIDSYRFP
ncbi:MAG: F0F1 ATP synthase subunit alpha [Candidatus Ryanbacteria bacterium RIFCSPHIGHO2_02_FULL_45_17b]|uniref:ATP synthase subunit alpha n=1 Tax=Candidatus Ryanbacteria bacterium RIFCSPHIGHO2_01_FULL_45_22 TaxID=1802114 RepID=A0A1G2G2B2_9BACT|nr:MAG: F0F1 ATP synthase subunit alpha [Candidatus Ryanbacteria bacterium RIFCSPHIGHO2_01_FULL_45_22]OGZ47073.1 MAG: F0F1 ATP synthase subunit alpha [Candidatus Ryanbacteria bacterium RIFCSPHIGHO2_02_FULL_45_17b]